MYMISEMSGHVNYWLQIKNMLKFSEKFLQ